MFGQSEFGNAMAATASLIYFKTCKSFLEMLKPSSKGSFCQQEISRFF